MSWIERIKSNITPPARRAFLKVWISVIAAVRFYTALSWNVILRSVAVTIHAYDSA